MSHESEQTQTKSTTIVDATIPVVEYKGQRVITLAIMDKIHNRPDGTAKRNFTEHKDKFEEGKHYFHRDYQQVKAWYEFRTTCIASNPQDLIKSSSIFRRRKFMKAKNYLLAFFLVFFSCFTVLSMALPSIVTAEDVCKSGCTYSTIQSAINAAVSGDTIRVVQGTYTETLSISSKSNISLQGGYKDNTFTVRDSSTYITIIDAQGTANTIRILNSDVITIEGFTIKNGQAAVGDDGGGVHVESDGSKTNVTLSNNSISGNYADYGGGVTAAANNSGRTILNLNNNDISSNRAYHSGGGLAFNAGTGTSSTVEVYSTGNTISGQSR